VAERNLRPWLTAVAAGLVLGTLLTAMDLVWAPFIGPEWQAFLGASTEQSSWRAVVLGVGYGGIAEEVMMRWGLMSLLALALVKISGSRGGSSPSHRVYVVAGLLSALIFAAGHLPALAQVFEPTGMLVTRTLVLNTIGGLVYAWFYWRRCLEAAMLAHAATHVGFALARSVL
jgi:membrane protease YdiL (CAAX protease family)